MSDERVRRLIAAVADGVTATMQQVRGLTDAELEEIERDQRAPLAGAYRCFLALAGGGAGRFLQGSDVFYPRVLGLGEAARGLLEENQVPFVLLDSDRVILMHQGYQFDFLRGSGSDPEVWSYGEGNVPEGPVRTFPRFTDWLESTVKEQTMAWARLVPWYEAERQKDPGDRRLFMYRYQSDGSVTEGL